MNNHCSFPTELNYSSILNLWFEQIEKIQNSNNYEE